MAGDSEAGLGAGGSRRGRRTVEEAGEAAWPAMPQLGGVGLFLVALGVGWTDRQTEMFNCKLFGYLLKALRDGGAFAVI